MSKVRKCAVPACGHRNRKYTEKRSMFQCPRDETKARKWLENIPGLDCLLPYQYVCEVHFEPQFVKRYVEERTNITRARLLPHAVPSIFNNISEHVLSGYFDNWNNHAVMSTLVHNAVNSVYPISNDAASPNTFTEFDNNVNNQVPDRFSSESVSRNHQTPSRLSGDNISRNNQIPSRFANESVSSNNPKPWRYSDEAAKNHQIQPAETSLQDIVKDLSASEQLLLDIKKEFLEDEIPKIKLEDSSDRVKMEIDGEMKEPTVYEMIENNISYYNSKIPESWRIIQLPIGSDQVFVFSKECTVNDNGALVVIYEKSIVLNENGEAHYSIHGKNINIENPDIPKVFKDIESLLNTIDKINDMKVCQGISTNEFEVDKDCTLSKDDLGFWRHTNCTLITDKLQCDICYEYSQYLLAVIANTPVLSDNPICYFDHVY